MAFRRTIAFLRKELGAALSARPGVASSASILWLLPVGAGGYYGYNSWTTTINDPWEKHKAISEGTLDPPRTAFMGEVMIYKVLPLRALSRIWGFVNDLNLPPPIRRPFLGWYVRTFGCNMDEAHDSELDNYPNLGALFRRKLKDGVRPVDAGAPIVSPADGHIIWFGEVSPDGQLEQVKGVSYSLEKFLGNNVVKTDFDSNNNNNTSSSLLRNPEVNSLYHCLIYLAPGDYHRYHSPADWTIEERKHFPGELFSVSPGVTRWLKGLFNYNERVVYSGTWEHGFFCYAPVGATNVGSIKAYFDPSLTTNLSRRQRKRAIQRGEINDDGHLVFPSPIAMGKGDPFGEFNLGSSIVLVFEAPKNFKFHLTAGQKIQCGNYMGRVEQVAVETVEKVGVSEVVADTPTSPSAAIVEVEALVEKALVPAEEAVAVALTDVLPVQPEPDVATVVPVEDVVPSAAQMEVVPESVDINDSVDVKVESVIEANKPSLVDSVISDVLTVDVNSPAKEVISLDEVPTSEHVSEPEQVATVA